MGGKTNYATTYITYVKVSLEVVYIIWNKVWV